MYIPARERKVIELLLESQYDVPIKQIADKLDVSARTVHRDLKGVEQVLETHGLTLKKKTGSGLAIIGSEEDRNHLKEAISDQRAVDYTPEERHVLILSRLLEAREPVKLMTLGTELGVTVATISHDLDKIEEDLTGFQLDLVRRRGYGVEIQGKEANIREAISYLIMQHLNELDFLKLLREQIQGSSSATVDTVSDHLLGLVNRETIARIEQTIESIRPVLTYHLADSAYIALVIHLSLAIERLQQGEYIRMEEEYLARLRSTREFEVAGQLIDQLEEIFELEIPEAETGYITMHLMGAKVRYDQSLPLEDSSLSVAFKAKQLIEFASQELNQNLHQSNQLLNDLVVHLKPSLYRIQHNMDIQNPLTAQIEQDYPELFEMLERAVAAIFPSLVFPKEETAYLVMHFASAMLNMSEAQAFNVMVVCSSGIGTAKILAAKLKQQFPEIQEVDHQSLFDLEKIDVDDYDLMVSTVPLADQENYVLVNPMLPTADVHRLQHALRRVKITGRMKKLENETISESSDQTLQTIQQSVSKIQKYAETVSELLRFLQVVEVPQGNKEDVLRFACRNLAEKGALRDADSVFYALLEREKIGGLGIPGTGVALFHTRRPDISNVSFSVLTLSAPISTKGMDGEMMPVNTIIVMLAPEDASKEALEVLSYLSSILVEDPASLEILESHEDESITRYISNQLHQFIKNNLSS
ncbi:BglG family transcription antiterminator [Halobacillus salinarum]|uniref:BglG family transcription antiterminator n=1 Tax=Halobacillus salinarum TaxID=2932257 RepID=A0ABY4EIX2_9BACI|nr:BglG family transcription antiterminator [Halobacillus salinarum]UOQ43818.1 BglG family transcription antiterminator [Halobacillus salinarum]